MRNLVKRMWKAAPVATVLLVMALAVGTFFAVRTASSWIYWNDPTHRDQAIAGWMTPGYISHSWKVPREVVINAVGLTQRPDGPRNLDQLADDLGRTLPQLIADVETAIAVFRASIPDLPATGDAGARP